MSLFEQIGEDIKKAMLAKETVKLEALRGVKKEFLEAKTSKECNGELTDEKAMQIIQKMIKQRKESATVYQEQGRADLAERELAEVAAIEPYLPAQMSAEELAAVVAEFVRESGATSIKDMGKVMGLATKKLAGKADGKTISEAVKKALGC